MKGIHESVFMSSLRAFLITLFVLLAIILVSVGVVFAYYGLTKIVNKETYSSKVKILPDAQGRRTKLTTAAPVILQLSIEGRIGADKLTGKSIEEILLSSREDGFKDRPVKAILLMINSPGGGANDSDMIYRHIKAYKERYKVPVYAFVNGLAASGGYYAACAADKIFASEVSLIGSVGCLAWPPFFNIVDAMGKIGVNALTVKAGEGKDQLNPTRPWGPDESKQIQILIDFLYNKFVDVVALNRNLDREKIINTIGAKVYPAPEAIELGLADQCCSTRSQVLTELAKAANIEGRYQVVGFESTTWWKKYFNREITSPLITGKIKHEFALPTNDGNPFSYIFTP